MANQIFPQKYVGYILFQRCDVQHFIGVTINTIYNFVQIKKTYILLEASSFLKEFVPLNSTNSLN